MIFFLDNKVLMLCIVEMRVKVHTPQKVEHLGLWVGCILDHTACYLGNIKMQS